MAPFIRAFSSLYIIVGVEEASTLTKFCTLYPNPSDGDVTLKVEGIPAKDLEYQLYDLKGQLIETQPTLDE
ncbi:MAG: T9SS type A sorting domain-containing protein [Saprospirales bacterium]|nr:T9SS type A sorting domain-containing protein [Saprospirales bacterium]